MTVDEATFLRRNPISGDPLETGQAVVLDDGALELSRRLMALVDPDTSIRDIRAMIFGEPSRRTVHP